MPKQILRGEVIGAYRIVRYEGGTAVAFPVKGGQTYSFPTVVQARAWAERKVA